MKSLYLFIFLFTLLNVSQSQNIEKLKQNTFSKIDTVRFSAYSDLVWELKDLNKTEALKYAQKLISEAEKSDYKKWIAQGYNDIGIVNLRNGNLDAALIAFQKSLKYRKYLNSPKDIVSSLAKIGNVYVEQLKYKDAINCFLEASKLCEKHNMKANLGMLYANIATVYNTLNQNDLALKFSRKALVIQMEFNNEAGYGVCYSTIGSCMSDFGYYDSAIYYLEKSKIYLYNNGQYNEYCTAVNNLGLIHRKFNHSEKGIPYYKEAIKVAKEIGDTLGYLIYETNLASTLIETGELQEAENIYNDAIKISKQKNLTENLFKIYRGAISLYIYKKDLKKANEYFDLFNNLKDSVFSRDFSKQLSEMQTKYEVEKKDATIAKNELEIERQKKEGAIKNIIILISIIVLLITVFVVVITKKYNSIKQQIKQQQLINETAFETEQTERKRIARDLHDSVGQKLSVVKMQLSLKDSDIKSATKLLDEAIHDVRGVSHNLMPVDLEKGLLVAIEELVHQINFTSQTTQVILSISSNISTIIFSKQVELYTYRIIQEVMSNALKYSNAKNININMDCDKNILKLVLSDDGVGFNIEEQSKIEGIGLKNIRTRIEQLKGTVQISSQQNKGTLYNITIPL